MSAASDRSVASSKLGVAGALGIEPRPSVLETDVLTVEHHAPSRTLHVKRSTLKRTLFHLFVGSVFAAKPTILATLQPLRIVLLVLHRGIIAPLAVGTGQCNDLPHERPLPDPYARMAVTMPEPTVLPPSRIAKRSPWSIAIGEIRSAVIVTLSPGSTLCRPPSSFVSTYTSALNFVCGVIVLGFASTIPRSTSSFFVPRKSTPMLSPASPSSSPFRNISPPTPTVLSLG